MKSRILTLLAVLCCLTCFQEARADVNTITDISYYEPTNSIRVTATTYFDYQTWCYYSMYHWGYVRKDDEVIGDMFSSYWYDGIDAYNELYFPYDPNAEYNVEAYPVLNLTYRHPIGDTYEDYYNYVQWSYGDPVYYPYYYGFTGPGPEGQINASTVLLGAVYSIFTEGAMAGPPHHLKVISDETITLPGALSDLNSCGQKQRRIKYRVVDSNGRNAGQVRVKETFPGNIVSSCTGYAVDPSPCENTDDLKGTFTDTLRTGCPSVGGSCGFDITPDTWSWCPRDGSPLPLSRSNHSVRYSLIKVRGQAGSWAGEHFYP